MVGIFFLGNRLLEQKSIDDGWRRYVDKVPARPWDEKMRVEKDMVIDAKTWTPFKLFDVKPEQLRLAPVDKPECVVFSADGRWVYSETTLNRAERLDLTTGSVAQTNVMFNGTVVVPRIHELKGDNKKDQTLWMSYTPQEVFTQKRAVGMAKGDVVIAGLGMGWLTARVASKCAVKNVIVVEQSKELRDWIWPAVKSRHLTEHQAAKVKFIIGDAKKIVPRLTADVALWDIWENLGQVDAEDEHRMAAASPGIKRTWFWGAHIKRRAENVWDFF